MKITRPLFYKNFVCIGSCCTDNCCCTDWEVDIDEKTAEYYKKLNSDFANRLKSSITFGDNPKLEFDKNGRCPFLNNDSLCDVYINLGEEHMGYICREHPRFYEWFTGLKEAGLGLCCEEVCRLLFKDSGPVTFETVSSDEEENTEDYNEELFSGLFAARNEAIKMLQNRKYSIKERALLLLSFGETLQNAIYEEQYQDIFEAAFALTDDEICRDTLNSLEQFAVSKNEKTVAGKNIIDLFKSLEYITDEWKNSISEIYRNLEAINSADDDFINYRSENQYEYEHLMVYFVYRYFLKSIYDEDVLSKIKFTVLSYFVISRLDILSWMNNSEVFTFNDRINNVKLYSKEVEYSDDNVNFLYDESYENKRFGFMSLIKAIM